MPRSDWPPVLYVHLAFQVMVGVGVFLAALAVWSAWLAWRRRLFESRRLLAMLTLATPLGFIGIEAGWMVTELGRQPWIIQGIMRTADAVTPVPGLTISLVAIVVIYLGLAAIVTWLVRCHVAQTAPRG